MKKTILLSILLIAFNSSAQLGVISIKFRDPIPYDQWYSYKGRKFENKVFYLNETTEVEYVIDEILEPWGLDITDAEIDSDGAKYWVLDNNNGYYVTVWVERRIVEPENSIITLITSEL